jgi:hypothetical protein
VSHEEWEASTGGNMLFLLIAILTASQMLTGSVGMSQSLAMFVGLVAYRIRIEIADRRVNQLLTQLNLQD